MLPKTIADASPLDPLLLLPLPDRLPRAPTGLAPLVAALTANLAENADNERPLPVLTANMRSATRSTQVLVNAARVGAADARAELDEADVGLRTVEYELARVREEMAVCMEYEPMYETMDLPSEDEFLASASPEVLASLPAEGSETRQYALIIARLEAELAAITEHEERVAALTRERDGLVRARREAKAKFDAVDVWLSDFAKTTNAMTSKIKDVAKAPSATAAS